MDVSDARKLKALVDENAKLKKLLAEAMLGQCDPEGCRAKKMVTPDVKRDAMAHACLVHGVSQRRACEVLSFDRSSIRYRSVRPHDASIRDAMKKVASSPRKG
jgi:predicted metal-binding transcription factor (methanogenesis marker protein 9)